MSLCTNSFEGGTDGVTLTQAVGGNTGGASGTYFNLVTLAGSGVLAFTNVQKRGTLGCRFATRGTSAQNYLTWQAQLGTLTDHYGSLYLYYDAAGLSSTALAFLEFRNSSTVNIRFRIKATTGLIEILNTAAGSVVATSSTAVNVGGWTRIEWHVVHSATVGQVTCRIAATNPDGAHDEEFGTAANQNFGADVDRSRIGQVTSVANHPSSTGFLYLDDIINGDSAWLSFGAAPQTITLTEPTETDTSQAATHLKAKAVGQPSVVSSAFAVTCRKTVTLGLAAEADTGLAATAHKTTAIGLAADTEAGGATARLKTKAAGLASETDAAFAQTHRKTTGLGVAADTETAQPVTHPRIVKLATNTNFALGPVRYARAYALGIAVDTESGLVISAHRASDTAVIDTVEETDTVPGVVASRKTRPVGQAAEADAALPPVRGKTASLQDVFENDIIDEPWTTALDPGVTARETSGVAELLIDGASTEDAYGSFVTRGRYDLTDSQIIVQVEEPDDRSGATVVYLQFGAGQTQANNYQVNGLSGDYGIYMAWGGDDNLDVGDINEGGQGNTTASMIGGGWLKITESAGTIRWYVSPGNGVIDFQEVGTGMATPAWAVAGYVELGLASFGYSPTAERFDNYNFLAGVIVIGEAADASAGQPIKRIKTKAIGQAAEASTAGVSWGYGWGSDWGGSTITVIKTAHLVQAAEEDTAGALAGPHIVTLGQAAETDTATPVAKTKTGAVAEASETDTAQTVTVTRQAFYAAAQAEETDTAEAVTAVRSKTIGQASETDTATGGTHRKTYTLGQGTYRAALAALTPVGYWHLDETSGTNADDASATGVDGTYHGTPALGGAGGPAGDTYAATFDGVDDYVEIPDNTAWSLTKAKDAFGRTTAAGTTWGAADFGGTWAAIFTTSGTRYSTDGTVAQINMNASATYGQSLDVGRTNVDVQAKAAWDTHAAGATTIPFELCGRLTDASNYYSARLEETTGGVLNLKLYKRVAGTATQLGTTVQIAASFTPGDYYYIRLQVNGTTVQAKCWAATGTQPTAWTVSATDSALTTGNLVAVRCSNSGASVNPVASYDDFRCQSVGMTVTAWIRPDVLDFADTEGSTDQYVYIAGKGEFGDDEWAFRMYNKTSGRPNRTSFYLFNLAGGLGAGAYVEEPVDAGRWYFYAGVYDPGDLLDTEAGVSLYKNGIFKQGPSTSTGPKYSNTDYNISPGNGSQPVRIGTRENNSYFQGGIAEVAIFDKILTAAEINALWAAGTQAAEADIAQPFAALKTGATIGQAAETDTATTVTGLKTKGVGQATETDTAQFFLGEHEVLADQTTETDAAQALTKLKAKAVTQPVSVNSSQALTHRKTVILAAAAETDTATELGIEQPTEVPVAQAVETDAAQAVTVQTGHAIGQAAETDAAFSLAGSKVITVGLAADTETPLTATAMKTRALGLAATLDTAGFLSILKTGHIGLVTELDRALRLHIQGATPPRVTRTRTHGRTGERHATVLTGRTHARRLRTGETHARS